jgi:hypothetical protein
LLLLCMYSSLTLSLSLLSFFLICVVAFSLTRKGLRPLHSSTTRHTHTHTHLHTPFLYVQCIETKF